jgi:hypothetical protein
MTFFRAFLKDAGITPEQLSRAIGIPSRTISYHYSTGKMPYILIWKISQATGIPMEKVVPDTLVNYWIALADQTQKTNKVRGRKKSWTPPTETESPKVPLSKILAAKPIIPPPVPTPVIPKPAPSIDKPIRKSVAELMGEGAKTISLDEEMPFDPDKIDDSLFSTSFDQNAVRKKR